MQKCPGQKGPIAAEFRICTQCGYRLEFFTDEMARTCPACHSRQIKEADPLCAAWCAAAAACLGDPERVRRIKEKAQKEVSEEDQERIQALIARIKDKCHK